MRNEREGMCALNIGMVWNIVCVVNDLHEVLGIAWMAFIDLALDGTIHLLRYPAHIGLSIE
jgi:hypothetical protein